MRYEYMIKEGDRVAVVRPRDGVRAADAAQAVAARGGSVAVVRPRDGVRAADAAQAVAARGGSQADLDAVLSLQSYTLVGFMSRNGKRILDHNGLTINAPETGDSLVGWAGLEAMGASIHIIGVPGALNFNVANPN